MGMWSDAKDEKGNRGQVVRYGEDEVPEDSQVGKAVLREPEPHLTMIVDMAEKKSKTGLVSRSMINQMLVDYDFSPIPSIINWVVKELRRRGVKVEKR